MKSAKPVGSKSDLRVVTCLLLVFIFDFDETTGKTSSQAKKHKVFMGQRRGKTHNQCTLFFACENQSFQRILHDPKQG